MRNKLILGALITAVLYGGIVLNSMLPRYHEWKPNRRDSWYYRVDRWTGKVYMLNIDKRYYISPKYQGKKYDKDTFRFP